MMGRINISSEITNERQIGLLFLFGVPPVFQLLTQMENSYPIKVWENHTIIHEGINCQFFHTFFVNNNFYFLLLDLQSDAFIKLYLEHTVPEMILCLFGG